MSPHVTAARAAHAVSFELDMNEVTAELYAALQHIENLNPNHPHNPLPATTAALPDKENEQ